MKKGEKKEIVSFLEQAINEAEKERPENATPSYKGGFDVGYPLGLRHAYERVLQLINDMVEK